MKIHILSDLHREFGPTEIPKVDVDLIVLAGDVATKTNGVEWIREFTSSTPTVYLCGNHEYYGDKLPRVAEKLVDRFRGSNVHVLEDSSITVRGWTIYGCTLWTDLALNNDWQIGASFADECMNDYKRIRRSDKGFRRLRAEDTRMIHLRSLNKMETFLTANDPKKTLIVTHHAPSPLSLKPLDRSKNLSCAYASNLDSFIDRFQPHLWIHGHVHHSCDYRIGDTRILCNPQGYPDERNPEFKGDLVLELS